MVSRCRRWQGWGDPRIKVEHALPAASALSAQGVLGIDAFVAACHAIGAYEYALVLETAIDQLTFENVDVLALDRGAVAVMRYLGFNAPLSFRENAIRCEFLKGAYRAYARRFRCAPVVPVVRAALCAVLRSGAASTTIAQTAADTPAEMTSTWAGSMCSPGPRRARMLLVVLVTFAVGVRLILALLSFFTFSISSIAIAALHALTGVNLYTAPWKLAGFAGAYFAFETALQMMRSERLTKLRTLVRTALPVLGLTTILWVPW